MRIAKVYIKNFRGYGENNTTDRMYLFEHLNDVDFVIFSGYNGFGKTGFFEAIEWCLTGKIKGLQETDIYAKNTMKKSSYLKFQSRKEKREREVVVRIVFDNGWGVTRKTKCNALEENGYYDILTDLNEQNINQQIINEKIKLWTGQLPEQIFKLSFNGQNRNTDFVKSTKAKERTSSLLEFMGLKLLDDIVTESDPRKRKKLNINYDNAKTEYNNVIMEVKRIDDIFKSNKWGSIEEYCKNVRMMLENINSYQGKMMKVGICQDFLLSYDTLSDLLNSFEKVRILKDTLEKQKALDERQIAEATKHRLQYEWSQIQHFLNSASLFKESNLTDLEKDKARFIRLREIYSESISKLNQTKQKVLLDVVMPTPIKNDTSIGITKEEKEFYDICLNVYKDLKSVGIDFSIFGDYNLDAYNIEREFRKSVKYVGFLKNLENIVMQQKTHFIEIEGILTEQKELLVQVQGFVNGQNEINSCPVCGGTEFIRENQNGKQELLEVISTKIAEGNLNIKERNDNLVKIDERLSDSRKKVKKIIRTKYEISINELQVEINRIKDAIVEACDLRIKCNESSFSNMGVRLSIVLSKVNQINEFKNKYQLDVFEIEHIIHKKKEHKSIIEEFLRTRFHIYDLDNLSKETEKENIIPLFKRKNLITNITKYVDDIIEFDIGTENRNILRQYEKKCQSSSELESKILLLEEAIKFRTIINNNSKILEYDLIETLIENNKLINWIYSKINPHPYFRELNLKIVKDETSILSAEDNDVYLDHIFSEAQMNVLSLSIFLGLILSINNYEFQQIFLDDPVQSLDDINVVSFIDLLRALIRSDHVNKNYIISTHDHNFSKLLKIKLRNYSFIEYMFISYGEEGPRIDTIQSNVLI